MKSLQQTISLKEVNRELQKLKSLDVLTSLMIEELDVSNDERLQLDYMQNYLGMRKLKGYRKLSVRFTATPSEQDSRQDLYLREKKKLTPDLLAKAIVGKRLSELYDLWKLELLIRQTDNREREFVVFTSSITLVLGCCIRLLADQKIVASPLFEYALPFTLSCSLLCVFVSIYLYCFPDPTRRAYLYSLFGFTLLWYACMVILTFWSLGF